MSANTFYRKNYQEKDKLNLFWYHLDTTNMYFFVSGNGTNATGVIKPGVIIPGFETEIFKCNPTGT